MLLVIISSYQEEAEKEEDSVNGRKVQFTIQYESAKEAAQWRIYSINEKEPMKQ